MAADLEFFFDAGCPFAWMTSRWVVQVVEATGISVGWRFISLKMINEDSDLPESYKAPQVQGLRFHRICAATRDRFGNDAVGQLYTAYGSAFWDQTALGGYAERMEVARAAIDFAVSPQLPQLVWRVGFNYAIYY